MTPAEETTGKLYDGRLLRRLAGYLAPHKPSVAATLVLLALYALFDSLGPLLTRFAIDYYLVRTAQLPAPWLSAWLPDDPYRGIGVLSAAYLTVVVFALFTQFGQLFLMNRTGQWAMFALRRDLMARLHSLDIAWFDRHPIGRTVTRVTTDVDTLNDLFTSGFVAIVGDLLMLVWLVAILLWLSPVMTLILFCISPLVLYATMRFRAQVSGSYRRIRAAIAAINAFLQEHIHGISVVQLFNREQRSRQDFDERNRVHMDAYKDSIHAYGWFYPVIEFLGMLSIASLLLYAGWAVPHQAATLGTLVAFFQYSLRFLRPIQDLSEKYNILQSATAASERIFQLLDTRPSIAAPARPKPLPADFTIAFENVWFAYKEPEWVLRDVSFTIAPGETVAIVGHTGAGKTTATNLLLRFYDVQKGRITIGGIDIREFDPIELRTFYSIVLQDPWLFTGDIASNIRLGTPGVTEGEIREAARRVNLLEFIDALPNGFGEPVAERGANFSTGQKQLIGFARALVHNPRILILDEATSSVDTETEIRIRQAQRELLRDRTALIIAHRLSTIQTAGKILVFHKGHLHESGGHAELVAAKGLYHKLYQLQYQAELHQPSPS